MGYHPKIKQRALELIQEGYVAQKIADIIAQELKDSPKSPCERTVRRWKNEAVASASSEANKTPSLNWIEAYKVKCGELPLIPDWLSKLVKGYSPGQRVSKEMKLNYSPPYWDSLLPRQRKQVLELVKWLGQDPDDYLEMTNRHRPGRPSDIRLHWKR
jgi:hypothetical protein